jgi:HEAT repeat protein
MAGESRFWPTERGAAVLFALAVYLVPATAAAGTALAFGAPLKDALDLAAQPVINATLDIADYKIEDIPLYIANLKDPDPQVRRKAAEALSHLKEDSKRVVQALERAFRDPEPEVRRAAIPGLTGKTAVEGEVSHYLLSALADPNESVRRDAVEIVAKQRVPTSLAVPLLLDVFDTDSDVRVRQWVLRELIKMSPADIAVRNAVIAGLDDLDGLMRAVTVLEYSKLAYHETQPLSDLLPVVVGLLGDDMDARVRTQAARTLRNWAQVNRERGWAPPLAGAALVAALYDKHSRVRSAAAWALAYYPAAPVAHGGLQRLYDILDDPDINVRTAATVALVRPSDNKPAVVQSLLANASSQSRSSIAERYLRGASYLALVRLTPEDDAVLPLLTNALLHEKGGARGQAIEALGLMGPRAQSAIPELVALYFADKYFGHRRVIVALAQIGTFDADVKRVFAAALGSSSDTLRRAAVQNLPKFGTAAADLEPQVRSLLNDRYPEIRASAAAALRAIRAE